MTILKYLSLAFFMTWSYQAWCAQLSPERIFKKCYSQLTNLYASNTHPMYIAVRNGMDPIDACMSILRSASLNRLQSNNSFYTQKIPTEESKAVLRHFQLLHYSWLNTKTLISNLPITTNPSTLDMYGEDTPALYWTRALLDPNFKFGQLMTSGQSLMPVRKNMAPLIGAYTGIGRDKWVYQGDYELAPTGELLGVQVVGPTPVSKGGRPSNFNLFGHRGGGVMGFAPYLRYNIQELPTYFINALNMPRKWSVSVFKDLLCRDAPVIRSEDSISYVDETSNISFRLNNGCVRCHASLDQMSGVVRQVKSMYANDYNNGGSGTFPWDLPIDTSKVNNFVWPTKIQGFGQYNIRSKRGKFVFRTYEGQLISREVENLQALGNLFSSLDDPYVCLAKRYFKTFVGIDVPLGDFNDPDTAVGKTLNKTQLHFWKEVVDLGKKLKSASDFNQDPMLLIEAILRKSYYQDTDPLSSLEASK